MTQDKRNLIDRLEQLEFEIECRRADQLAIDALINELATERNAIRDAVAHREDM